MNPILLDFPDSFETTRLLVRSPLPGDGAAVNEAIRESIDSLRPWMPWADHIPEVDDSEANVRQARVKFLERSDMRLHLFLKSTGEFVGSSGLHRINWSVPKFEIGYWVRNRLSGQGLITEAVEGITQFAFNTLLAKRVEIRCNTRNTRSAAIPKRLGFELEATLRNYERDVFNELSDEYIFAKIR